MSIPTKTGKKTDSKMGKKNPEKNITLLRKTRKKQNLFMRDLTVNYTHMAGKACLQTSR